MTKSQTTLTDETLLSRTDAIPLPKLRPSFSYTMEKVIQHLGSYSKPTVLDIGCGRKSDIGRYLKERQHPAIIHGADLDKYSRKNQDVDDLFICDVIDMPFEDNTYDAVFSQFLLEHIADCPATIRSIARVTAPKGLISLIIPNPTSPASMLAKLTPYSFHLLFKEKVQNYGNVSEDTFPTLFAFKSIKNLKKQMEDAGFSNVEVKYVPEIFYRFRFRPTLVRLAMVYVQVLNTLHLNMLKASVVITAEKKSS